VNSPALSGPGSAAEPAAGSAAGWLSQLRYGSGGGIWAKHIRLLAISWIAILALLWRDTADIVMIWWDSSTFNHCLIIVPILAWLVAQRRALLASVTPTGYWPALLYCGIGAFGWLLGDAAGVAVARHAGLIMMLQGSVAAILGLNVLRGLLFPIFYMFFLIPFGEEFVPILQTVTAKMCMVMLDWTGIPAVIDGIFITTPNGYFRVAEACAGVMFLVAMVAYGALVANMCFRSWTRRIAFMAICVIVPIIANGIRAFGTIYIAEKTGIGFAAGFDHIFYGWIFFAIVIAIVMAIGWRFFDKPADAAPIDPATLMGPSRHPMNAIVAACIAVALAAAPLLWSSSVSAQKSTLPAQISAPVIKGWQVIPYMPTKPWRPQFAGANYQNTLSYRNDRSETIDFTIVLYDRQAEGRELVGFGNGAIDPDNKWDWVADMPAPINGKAERIKTPILTTSTLSRDVVSFYRLRGKTTGSSMQVKLATLQSKLLGGNQSAAAILISAEYNGERSQRAVIDQFLRDANGVDKIADQLVGIR
jgi:exosortase A